MGTTPYGAVTVAVKVIVAPPVEGFSELLKLVLEVVLVTATEVVPELPVNKPVGR